MSLLTEMDGIEELNGVVVLAATNRPDVIVSETTSCQTQRPARYEYSLALMVAKTLQDSALMRPGRLDRILYVSPPDLAARGDIFRLNFAKMAIAQDVDVQELADMVRGTLSSFTSTSNLSPVSTIATSIPLTIHYIGSCYTQTEGCSGAEIASICQDAALSAMNEDIEIAAVARRHLYEAARTVRRRITPQVVQEYEQWRDRSGLRSA